MKAAFSIVLLIIVFGLHLHAQELKLILPVGHTDAVNSAQFSPDGKEVVTASDDHTAKIWDAQTGDLLANLTGHSDKVLSACFDQSGKKVITVSANYTLKVWDAKTGAILLDLQIDTLPKGAVKLNTEMAILSPDNEKIITFSAFHTPHTTGRTYNSIKVWDINTGALLHNIFKTDNGTSYKINLSVSGNKIIALCNDGTTKIWDILNGKLLANLAGGNSFNISSAYSADGEKILTASRGGLVKIWSNKTKALIDTIRAEPKYLWFAAFNPDGKKIITVAFDGTIKIWALNTKALLYTYSPNLMGISCYLSLDGKKIITTTNRGIVQIRDIENGKLLLDINDHDAKLSTVKRLSIDGNDFGETYINGYKDIEFSAISPDGEKIATAIGENAAKIWNVSNGELIRNLTGHSLLTNAVVFSSDSKNILTISADNLVRAWNTTTGRIMVCINGHTDKVASAVYSPDDKEILTASFDYTAKIWDAGSGNLLSTIDQDSAKIYSAAYSPDGKEIVTASFNHTVKVWDVKSGAMLHGWMGPHLYSNKDAEWGFSSAVFSPDGKLILAKGGNNIFVFNNETRAFLGTPKAQSDGYSSAFFSNDGNRIIATNKYDATTPLFDPYIGIGINLTDVFDTKTGHNISSLKGYASNNSLACSPNGLWAVTINDDKTAKVWDLKSGRMLTSLTGHTNEVTSAVFSPDGEKIVTASLDGTAKVWQVFLDSLSDIAKSPITGKFMGSDKFTGDSSFIDHSLTNPFGIQSFYYRDFANWKMTANLTAHTGKVESAIFSPDGKKIITLSDDNTTKLWDAASGKLIYTFFALDSVNYFDQVPQGYYMCSPDAARLLHYVTKNAEEITFDQLDIKYNRPDKVLEAIGCRDTALIKSYKKAYEKRIERLEIDTAQFKPGYSVPKADFENRAAIQYEQKQDKLWLHIYGSDDAYALERFNVWVNQVPVYGMRGISLKKRNRKILDTLVNITLSTGENRIETAVTDINGTESYHIPLNVKYITSNPADTLLYFAGIGIDHFADTSHNLKWSVKDIRDLALKFKEKYGNKCIIDTLFNQNASINNITALKKILLQSKVNDKVVLAYAGHGLFSKDWDYFLSTYAVDFNDPAKQGLPYADLENLIDSIPARKKLMLIDACNSGEIDKDEMARYTATKNQRRGNGVTDAGYTATAIEAARKNSMSMTSSFELMKQLFANVGQSTGATIISAAGGVQYALENGDLKNGIFTYSILENMQQHPHNSISALKLYVNKRVAYLTAYMQVPTTRNETDLVDWPVW